MLDDSLRDAAAGVMAGTSANETLKTLISFPRRGSARGLRRGHCRFLSRRLDQTVSASRLATAASLLSLDAEAPIAKLATKHSPDVTTVKHLRRPLIRVEQCDIVSGD